MSDFTDLDLRIARLVDQVTPGARAALARKLASYLRKANAQRIRDNVEPDDEAMAPRQSRKQGKSLRQRIGPSALRREAMFAKVGGAKFLRARTTPEGAKIGFAGATARIMRVHQLGLRDRVKPIGPAVMYPIREVLGISDGDRARLLDIIAGHFETGDPPGA